MKYIFLIQIFCFIHHISNGQTPFYDDEKLIKHAKRETINQLSLFGDSLTLNKKDIKIKKFEIKPCNEPKIKNNLKSLTPAGEFEIIEGCPGAYFYNHKTNNEGSGYSFKFFFDSTGNLIHTNIYWILVTH